MNTHSLKTWLAAKSPILLGIGAFFAIVGPRALYPTNIAWLSVGDPATHYLGWHFFRHSEWSFPLGLNPDYGLELSSAILFADSNPLLALLFKPFSPVLPETFQYLGIWLLACFVLQAWFGWKLVGLISSNPAIRFLGAGLFVFAPPMVFRLLGHFALMGHFLILAGVYLALRPAEERRALPWVMVLVAAAMVNSYLLAMVASFWLADLAQVVIRRPQTWRRVGLEFLEIAGVVGLTCWQVGYFTVGAGVSAGGYGFFRMNLLSLVDPSGWSYVLMDIPGGKGEGEGFNFLGLGVLVLAIAGLPSLIAGHAGLWSAIRRRWPLLLTLAGLFVYALSNKVGVGSHEFEIMPLGHILNQLANVFRASGRMAWPVFYVLVVVAIFVVVRGNSVRVAAVLLGLALVVQIADTRAAWQGMRQKLMTKPSAEWVSPLKSVFWDEAAGKYDKVRWIYPDNVTPQWQWLSYYAARHGLATDAVYLARVGPKQLHLAKERAASAIRTGNYERDSLYVLDQGVAGAAFLTVNQRTDLLAKIDGFYVIAPGWNACGECSRPGNEVTFGDLFPPVKIGERLEFTQTGKGQQYLVSGWNTPEPLGTWSEGNAAEILFQPFAKQQVQRLVIEGDPAVSASHPQQTVEVFVNDVWAAKVTLTAASSGQIEVIVPEEARARIAADSYLRLRLVLPDAARPVDIGINDDPRRLALALRAIIPL